MFIPNYGWMGETAGAVWALQQYPRPSNQLVLNKHSPQKGLDVIWSVKKQTSICHKSRLNKVLMSTFKLNSCTEDFIKEQLEMEL